jgi:hypothetical protein
VFVVGVIVAVSLLRKEEPSEPTAPPATFTSQQQEDQKPAEAKPVALTAEEQAEKAKQEAKKAAEQQQWLRDVVLVRAVRDSIKNPASFQLEEIHRMDDGTTLCLTYRATNSFNAVIPGRTVITNNKAASSGEEGFAPLWNKLCSGKMGTDISYIRHAI